MDSDGTFTAEKKSWIGNFTGRSFIITIADFNNDHQLDLAFANEYTDYIYILLGNGDGTFRILTTIFMGYVSHPKGIATSHFNNDNYTDIVVANEWNSNIGILLGLGNGTFSSMTTYYTGRNSYPTSIVIGDFNNDSHQDIAVSNFEIRSIIIFLGHGDGSFEEPQSSFTGGYYYPNYIAVGDFNNDQHLDVVCSYHSGTREGVLFGYGNGSLGNLVKFVVGNRVLYPRIAVGDFNNDDHLDIVLGAIEPYSIRVLVGDGDGNFEVQTVFSVTLSGSYTWVDVTDFNNDGCQDIVASDDTNGVVYPLLNTCACRNTSIRS